MSRSVGSAYHMRGITGAARAAPAPASTRSEAQRLADAWDDLARMKRGDVQHWFIERSRDFLMAQGYITPFYDEKTNLFPGTYITDEGLEKLKKLKRL